MDVMKRILLPFVSALIASNIFAAPIPYDDAKRARGGVPIYDVVTLSRDLDGHMGELIAVQCNFRGKDIHHLKPNWYEGSIWKPDPEKRGEICECARNDREKGPRCVQIDSNGGIRRCHHTLRQRRTRRGGTFFLSTSR
jgi:hypothetical protein